jgi:ribosome-interacting GTPase 1
VTVAACLLQLAPSRLLYCCRSPPNIYFKKKKTGGVSINSTLMMTKMDDKLIQRVLQEYKIHNCEVSCS